MSVMTSTLALQANRNNAASRPAAAAPAQRRVDSRLLLRESRELVIEHLGQEYRLRRTRNDKLILTK
ncbi:hemin uptake protein HemP [Tahibacter sp. P2K]|uniref:Hemin uptake protein HemP n=2 Tax=Tahibacter harae TaxID=2963937 RepID=A0ABT1QZE0_9GAMM|nr:hemin uptake protein HemP [Tahibacter harae]MCQ4167641.1 hemin uptake protein HemP [Tahibacter harae]